MSFNEPSVKDLFDIEVAYTNNKGRSNTQMFVTKTLEYANSNSAFVIDTKPGEKPMLFYVLKPKFLRR
jgi:hypothetical protein